MVGQLFSDRLRGGGNGPRQAFRRGHGLRRVQPRELRPRLRIGRPGTTAVNRVANGAGRGTDRDARRPHHVPARVRRTATVGTGTVTVRPEVRPAVHASAAVFPHRRATDTVILLSRPAYTHRRFRRAHGRLRAVRAARDVHPRPGRVHSRVGRPAEPGFRGGRRVQGFVRSVRSETHRCSRVVRDGKQL